MSKRKAKEELEGNEDSLGKRRSPNQATTTGNVSGQSSLESHIAHQMENQNEQVGLEVQNAEVKRKSALDVLKKVFIRIWKDWCTADTDSKV